MSIWTWESQDRCKKCSSLLYYLRTYIGISPELLTLQSPILLLPRGSFVIVIFWVFMKKCYNCFRGVRNQNTWFWKTPIWIYVCACVRACVYAWISASTRSILITQVSFFSLFLCDCWSKIRFLIGSIRFCIISKFQYSKIYFCFF